MNSFPCLQSVSLCVAEVFFVAKEPPVPLMLSPVILPEVPVRVCMDNSCSIVESHIRFAVQIFDCESRVWCILVPHGLTSGMIFRVCIRFSSLRLHFESCDVASLVWRTAAPITMFASLWCSPGARIRHTSEASTRQPGVAASDGSEPLVDVSPFEHVPAALAGPGRPAPCISSL